MNTVYIVQFYDNDGNAGGIISVHFNKEDAEKVLLKYNDDGDNAFIEQWKVEN